MAQQIPASMFRASSGAVTSQIFTTQTQPIFVQAQSALGGNDALSLITNRNGQGLTPEQVSFLSGLRYSNGAQILDLKNEHSFQALTEIISLMENTSWEETQSFLSSKSFLDIKDLVRSSPLNVKIYENVIEEQNLEIVVGEGIEGFGECKKCGNKKLTFTLQQIRRADEGMDAIYRCPECQASGGSLKIY